MSKKVEKLTDYNPYKISITGIDGSGKSTATDAVALELGKHYRVARVSRPAYSVVNGVKNPYYQRLLGAIDSLHATADKTENLRYVLWVNALHVALQGRVIEPGLIKKAKPDILLTSRDYIIDPAVYTSVYAPKYSAQNMVRKIKHMQRITGLSYRDVVFLLTVPPDVAMKRIEQRIAKEKLNPGAAEREKWLHVHEEPETLGNLQSGYFNALKIIQALSEKTQIEIVDTYQQGEDEVAKYILIALRNLLSKCTTKELS